VPTDRFAKVLHLCRYPDRCCKVCDRTDHDAATTAATTRHPSLADPGRPLPRPGMRRESKLRHLRVLSTPVVPAGTRPRAPNLQGPVSVG
jgi:hypothetical protein